MEYIFFFLFLFPSSSPVSVISRGKLEVYHSDNWRLNSLLTFGTHALLSYNKDCDRVPLSILSFFLTLFPVVFLI